MKVSARGWAITGDHGLYIGWWLTRAEAIAGHCHDLFDTCEFPNGRALDEAQKTAWRKCRKVGDRAMRIKIQVIE